jgi:hypothetical protein
LETTEIIGYSGLLLIAASFFFTNRTWLRIFSLLGAIVMTIYCLLIDRIPVTLLGVLMVIMNLYYLFKMSNRSAKFDMVDDHYKSGGLFDVFYRAYEGDIKKYFPEFNIEKAEQYDISIILRDVNVVGAFVYKPIGKEVHVRMDYVAPKYRDLSNSTFLMAIKSSEFKAKGFEKLVAASRNQKHSDYLKKIGFQLVDDATQRFELTLE